jgi:hypothetical protein
MDALAHQFLDWLAAAPRSYGETMETWRTSCPRMPVWEDAVREGLIELMAGGSMKECQVVLTPLGRSKLVLQAEASRP